MGRAGALGVPPVPLIGPPHPVSSLLSKFAQRNIAAGVL